MKFISDLIFPTAIGRLLMDQRVPAAFIDPSIHKELIKELTMINQYHFSRDEFIKAFSSTLANFPLTNTVYAYEKGFIHFHFLTHI